jgi:hypothetical protein
MSEFVTAPPLQRTARALRCVRGTLNFLPARALSALRSSPRTPPDRGWQATRHGARRGGRVVDRTALEMRHRCKPIGGSNPSLSATLK